MQANLKGGNPPPGNTSRSHHRSRQNFFGIALLVARRGTLRHIGPLPPIGLKVSHFFSFGKDCRYPDEPAGESTPENEAPVRRAETKFSKINLFSLLNRPAGRNESGRQDRQA
jgi:hypothetical protein